MKRVLLVSIAVLSCSVPILAGEYLMNDTGQTAYGLRVVFSEPVEIAAFGDALKEVVPTGVSTEFTFSGGELEPWAGHWFRWEPPSAAVVEHQWIGAVCLSSGRASDYVLELISESSLAVPSDANVDIVRLWATADEDTIVVRLEFKGFLVADYIADMKTLTQVYFRCAKGELEIDGLYKVAITGHSHSPGLYGPPDGRYLAKIPSEIKANSLTLYVPRMLLPDFDTLRVDAEARAGHWGNADTQDQIQGIWPASLDSD